MRYLPPNGTAGFAIFFVKAPRRLPCPPAKIIARYSVFLIKIPPGAQLGTPIFHLANHRAFSAHAEETNVLLFRIFLRFYIYSTKHEDFLL